MTAPIRVALIGLGKIARDQHLPAISASPDFALTATIDPIAGGIGAISHFADLDALAASGVTIDAVAICTPPQGRYELAARAIARGWHVLLEKPPAATLSEAAALERAAAERTITVFAAWHSRFAAGVEPARTWLAARKAQTITVTWREDVRVWHPGQTWLWEPGGFGVFDPGINALSILSHILPQPLFIDRSELTVPENRAAPITARLYGCDAGGAAFCADFDFRQQGPQRWDIAIETDDGDLMLRNGGADLSIDGAAAGPALDALDGEYAAIYRRFATLVRERCSDMDLAPLRLVADCWLRALIDMTEPFDEHLD